MIRRWRRRRMEVRASGRHERLGWAEIWREARQIHRDRLNPDPDAGDGRHRKVSPADARRLREITANWPR